MTNTLSRRDFLKRTPAAAVAVATPTAMLAAPVLAAEVETPDAEIARLARELLAKVKTHHGGQWDFVLNEDSGAIFIWPKPKPRIVEFSGPGLYEVEEGEATPVFTVTRSPQHDHAAEGRCFKLVPQEKRHGVRYVFEPWLRTILIRKIGGAA